MNNINVNPDPNDFDALVSIPTEGKWSMPLVYICSPYAGDIDTNIQNAKLYCRYAIEKDCIPIAPHLLYPQILNEDNADERALGLYFALRLLRFCDEVWVFGDKITDGMRREIYQASKDKTPVKCMLGVRDGT